MMIQFYTLDANRKLVHATLEQWAEFFSDIENRRVARDKIGALCVSTVFLGYDHGFGGSPLYFETMIFDDDHSEEFGYSDHCATWQEAEAMHAKAVEYVRRKLIKLVGEGSG